MFLTKEYKNNYIHFSTLNGVERIEVQIDSRVISVRSEHQAKCIISRVIPNR